LEKDGRVGRALRISQETLELLEALLPPKDRALLLSELVTQALTFPLELGKLPLELRTVPEETQQPVIID